MADAAAKPAPKVPIAALQRAIQRAAAGLETTLDRELIRRAWGDPRLRGPLREAVEAFHRLDEHDDRAELLAARAAQARDAERRRREADARALQLGVRAGRHDADDTQAQLLREEQREAVPVIHAQLASNSAGDHLAAAGTLAQHDIDWLAGFQHAYAQVHRQSLYGWLSRQDRRTPGHDRVLELLRASHADSAAVQREFGYAFEYLDEKQLGSLVDQLQAAFLNSEQGQQAGYRLLLRQPARVLEALASGTRFRRLFWRVGFSDFLIDHVERSEWSLRALAVLRERAPDVARAHVELAVELIPLSGSDARGRVVRTLEQIDRVPEGARTQVEAQYDRTWRGVGHLRGQHQPDTLRGHLKALEGRFDVGHYHHALALLHHRPTEAEELYFLLSRWGSAQPAEAIALLKKWVDEQLPRQRLESDWERHVRQPQPGNDFAFTALPLRQHLGSALRLDVGIAALGGQSNERQVMLLIAALRGEEANEESSRLAAEAQGRLKQAADHPGQRERLLTDAQTLNLAADETRLRAAEDSRLNAASVMLNADVMVADGERLAALKQIRQILLARVERQQARLTALDADVALPPSARGALKAAIDALLAHDRVDADIRLGRLARQVDEGRLPLAWDAAPLARSALSSAGNLADEIYILAIRREFAQVYARVLKAWAGGGSEALIRDAGRATIGRDGRVLRPAFRFAELARRVSDHALDEPGRDAVDAAHDWVKRKLWLGFKGPLARVVALTREDLDDAHRGAACLHAILELDDSTRHDSRAAPDLADAVRFFDTPGLTAERAEAAIAAYVGIHFLNRRRPQQNETPVRAWLRAVHDCFEGDSTHYLALAERVLPARSDAERAERVRLRDAVGDSSVVRGFADWWERSSGSHRRAAAARSRDWLLYFAQASPAEQSRMRRASGLATAGDIGEHYYRQYQERMAVLKALEDGVVDRLADLVELAIDVAITAVTGGAALPAVLSAMAAAMANITVHEILQRKEVKTLSIDNLVAVANAGVGAFAVEGGLREKFVIRMLELKGLGAAFNGGGRHLQESVQNIVTGVLENSLASAIELSVNTLSHEFGIGDDEVRKHRDQMLGKVVGKAFGTRFTVHWHPGLINTYTRLPARIFIQSMFKTGLRVESIFKELVKHWYSSAADQPFIDTLGDIALKIAFGEFKSLVKAQTSARVGLINADAERLQVTRFKQQDPVAFADAVLKGIRARYAASDGDELRASIHQRRAADPKLDEDSAMLSALRSDRDLAALLHKEVRKAADAALGVSARQGLRAERKGAEDLPALIDAPDVQPHIAAASAKSP